MVFPPDPEMIYRWMYYWDPEREFPPTGEKGFGPPWGWWHGPAAEQAAELIDKAVQESDFEKRKELYLELHKIIAEEIPILQLHHFNLLTGMREEVKGKITRRPDFCLDNIRYAYFEKA